MSEDPILDRVMLEFSKGDRARFRDFIEGGAGIFGGLGSGKSSTSARMIALAFLRAGLRGPGTDSQVR
jgi:hypothetical protein